METTGFLILEVETPRAAIGVMSLQTEDAELFYRNLELRAIHATPAVFAER